MKTAELKEKGLTDEQIAFVMAENGKDVAKLQKELGEATAERDKYKQQAEEATKTLEGFDGVDVEGMKAEIAKYKAKAEELQKDYEGQIYQRDFEDALKEALAGIEFTSEAAKKAVTREIQEAGLKLKDGKILGLSDLISQIKEADSSAFKDKAQDEAEKHRAQFTGPMGTAGKQGAPKPTKESIMAIKDRGERRKAIAENMDLFGGETDDGGK